MAKDKEKKIVILTDCSFPVGLASTNRILSYCKGFLYNGYQPEVICFKPTDTFDNILNTSVKGIYNDINYIYPGGKTTRSASFFIRRKDDAYSFFASLKLLFKYMKRDEASFIIYYGTTFVFEFYFVLLSKFFKTGIYKEESEHPHIYFFEHKSIFKNLIEWLYTNYSYRYYTGILAMTNSLKDFFLTKKIKSDQIIVVPHTVDLIRFEYKEQNSTLSLPDEYIAYLGPIDEYKDGILTLVESFSEISIKFPNLHLVLAGYSTDQEKEELLLLVDKLKLNERIHYLGRISYDDIPLFFHGAKLLVSCRKYCFQNIYSFPTKVIEYLATGLPVVTTSPGDLEVYMKDRVNAFVADSDDKKSIASKVIEALEDYSFALKVGQTGKDLVRDQFNPNMQTEIIINFAKKTNNR